MAFKRASLIDVETMEVVDEFVSWGGEHLYFSNVAAPSIRGGAMTRLPTISW
ncbi:hypothetical protein [Erythrobacter sp.]|uniref:hypothetical protein n=1 Tax=Sphingomonadales TaxID=204457 RepID=UPI0032650FCB